MDFATESPAEIGMPKLVNRFDAHEPGVKQEKIAWGKDRLALIAERGPVFGHDLHGRKDHRAPHRGADGADQESGNRQCADEELIGVQQWKAHEHDIEKLGALFPLAGFLVALEQLRGIGGQVVLQ